MRRPTAFLLLATCLCTGAMAQSEPGAPPSAGPAAESATPVLVERQQTIIVPADAVVLVPAETGRMGASSLVGPDKSRTLGTGEMSTLVNGQPNVDPDDVAIHAQAHGARSSM
jgi:hypothetical protein